MAVKLDKIFRVFFLWLVFSWKCTECQNAKLTANPATVSLGGTITLTCMYIGSKPETAITWLNSSNIDVLTLIQGSPVPQCDVFSTVNASFDPSRLHYTCDETTNNYTLTIYPVKENDFGVKWSCTFLDPLPNTTYSELTINKTAVTNPPSKTCDTVVGFAVGFGLGIPIALIIIVAVIFRCKGCKRPMWFGILLVIGLCIIFIICCIIIIILIVADITICKVELGLGLGLSSGLILLIVFIIAVIFKCCSCSKFNGTNDEEDQPKDDSIYAYVGTDADFSFMLTEDSNEAEVLIKNKSGGIVMTVHGKKSRSDDSLYKDRVTFTGNTKQMQISFILRNVTLADAGIYTAVHSDTKRTIGHQELKVKEVSPVETCVGTDADFSFMLNEDSDEVVIKKKSGDILMIAHGKKGRSDDPSSYKDRVTFTGDTNQLQISFILRNVTLEDDGIYTAVLTNPVKTIGCQKLIVTEVPLVQTYVGSDATFSFMLTENCKESEVLIKNESGSVVMIASSKVCTSTNPLYKDRVTFTGNTKQNMISFILRNVTLADSGTYIAEILDAKIIIGCLTLVVKVKKSKTNNSGTSAIHTRTQNKVEPDTIIHQTNDRQQPVSMFRPQPPLPLDGETKDRSRRGISATIDDSPDLAIETPRPIKLPPLPIQQATVQNEDASKERKKEDASKERKRERRKNKKKNQINEETPEEESVARLI